MNALNRREFLQRTAGTCLVGVQGPKALGSPEVRESETPAENERFCDLDQQRGVVTGGPNQPVAMVNRQGQPAYVHISSNRAAEKTWMIGNSRVERVVQFDQHGLYTTSWRNKVTGTDFIRKITRGGQNQFAFGSEFSFQANSRTLRGAERVASSPWTLIGADVRDVVPAGKRLETRLMRESEPIEVDVSYVVYEGHPVIRKWLTITNRGSMTVTLTHLAFEDANLVPGKPDEMQVCAFYGIQPREIFFTGRAEDTAIVSRNSRTAEGFAVMNGAPGWTKRTEMTGWGEGVKAMYDTDIFPFERRLEPGESFTTAASNVAAFAEGHDLEDPRWVLPGFTSAVLMRKGTNYQPPWIYNTWEPFERSINQSIAKDLVSVAHKMGLDIFTIDDGWQQDYGENRVNLKAFPGGLGPIRQAVENGGMRLGLWAPLAAISPKTRVYREHPDWACRDQQGHVKTTGTMAGEQVVMCLASPYRDDAARRLTELVAEFNLKYIKIDLTTVFNAYGESPGCWARGHYHHDWSESLERIYEGIQYVTGRVYREHPNVLLDLTFELWGQKHVIDYGLLNAGDLDWLSNVDDSDPSAAGPLQARTLLYQRSLAIPTETMLIGNLHADMGPIEERFGTAIGAGPLFLGDLRKLTSDQQSWYAEKIQWFKRLRREVQINEGFFPLGAWFQPGAANWDGFARLSHQGEGLAVVFKNRSGVDQVNLRLPMPADGPYRIRSVMAGEALGTFSGEQLKAGLGVKLPPKHTVEILEIRNPEVGRPHFHGRNVTG
jgi:alpha-galactosidase